MRHGGVGGELSINILRIGGSDIYLRGQYCPMSLKHSTFFLMAANESFNENVIRIVVIFPTVISYINTKARQQGACSNISSWPHNTSDPA
jgi:hypothetical protein